LAEAQEPTGQTTKCETFVAEETAPRHRQRQASDAMASLDFLAEMGRPEVRQKARG